MAGLIPSIGDSHPTADGLTAQIPSFVISIASALIVTRSGSKQQLGTQLADQMSSQPKGLVITAAFLAGVPAFADFNAGIEKWSSAGPEQ